MVTQVRRFTRIVTQRVGALNDRVLAGPRSLGEARVLWEIGDAGREVRDLRGELGLDSGYLSRLLRGLEAAGLVRVGPKADDRRVRMAWLTPAGAAERAALDARSDELAESVLAPLGGAQRARLVAAMADVERLLSASMVVIAPADPGRPDARRCLRAYFAELDRRFADGFDPARSVRAGEDELRPPEGLFLVASLRGEPVGCGALRLGAGEPAELTRMWVAEAARGLGLGRRLLRGARGARRPAGRPGRPPGDQRLAGRGHRALSLRRLRGGGAVQRRGLRPPLVPEAAGRGPGGGAFESALSGIW